MANYLLSEIANNFCSVPHAAFEFCLSEDLKAFSFPSRVILFQIQCFHVLHSTSWGWCTFHPWIHKLAIYSHNLIGPWREAKFQTAWIEHFFLFKVTVSKSAHKYPKVSLVTYLQTCMKKRFTALNPNVRKSLIWIPQLTIYN